MGPFLRLPQLEARPPQDDLLAVGDEVLHDIEEAQRLRLLVDDGQHDDAEGDLELGVLVEVVEDDLRQLSPLDLDDDAHALAVGLVADVGHPLDPLVVDELGDRFEQARLVDLVGDLENDDLVLFAFGRPLDEGLGPEMEDAPAVPVGVEEALAAVDDAARRKVRALDVLEDVLERGVGVLDEVDDAVADLRQVVGRDVRGHADGDAVAAVDEEVGELRGQDLGHGQALVVVRDEVDRFLVDVGHELVGQLLHPDFGVAHGRRRVAVDAAEVALPVDEQVAQAEVLGHADQRVVGGLVAVRMVLADDVADDAGRLLVGLVVVGAALVHGVEDAAVDRLEAVLDVRDGPADDDAHGVVEVGPAHLLFEAGDREVLFRLVAVHGNSCAGRLLGGFVRHRGSALPGRSSR
ncbi:MAG: hypothetical protein H6P96_1272 [Candidatus Aminicenantes bacterium]|nr:hypothetical protein [Candidatus Aminicenantes bacterium]